MDGRLVAALLLVLVGSVWLLETTGLLPFPGGIGTWWPSVAILVGVVMLLLDRARWRVALPIILGGALFQLWTLGQLPRDAWRYVAPAALILLGLFLLVRRGAPRAGTAASRPGGGSAAVFTTTRFQAAPGDTYRGGELTAIFGDLDADLTRATLPPEGARLKVTSVFGGARVRVPPDWRVELRGTPIFGDTDDRTPAQGTGPRLDVDAVALFGQVRVTGP